MKFIPRRCYAFYSGELAELARANHWIRARADETIDPVTRFGSALAAYHCIPFVRVTHSGRTALIALLKAAGLAPGDEIIVPAYTFRALIELIAASGYVPVPADINRRDLNLSPDDVARHIGPRTRAILATHLFGRPCALTDLKTLATRHGLLLIEDCAQAMGSEWQGQKVGSIGDAAILSFDLLKPINSIGGGAILTRHPGIAERLPLFLPTAPPSHFALAKRIGLALLEHAILRSPLARIVAHALAHPATQAHVARSYRRMQTGSRPAVAAYTPLQARIALHLLATLDGRTAQRRALLRRLSQLLDEIPAASIHPGENGYFFVRLVNDKISAAQLRQRLLQSGIDAGIGAEVADYCGDIGRATDCPVARDVAARAIQLPLYEGLDEGDLQRIASVCKGYLARRI